MTKYSELMEEAIAALTEDEELFVRCIDELDSWNGYADGFRCYEMYELDDLCSGMKVSEFVEKLYNFNSNDDWFYFSIWGITTTDSKVGTYSENVDEGELLDNLLDNYDNIDIKWIDEDFDRLLQEIIETRDSERS